MKNVHLYYKNGEIVNAYETKDIENIKNICNLISQKIKDEIEQIEINLGGDRGTCVLGDCFEIYFIAPRKRYACRKNIFSKHDVKCGFMQSEISCQSIEIIKNEFKKHNIDLHYNCGNMD